MFVIIGIILQICIVVAVKLYDDDIRKKQWRKRLIVWAFFISVICILYGIISLFIE